MALNYNTFQALSATEVFVLQNSALSFIQVDGSINAFFRTERGRVTRI